MPWQRIIQQTAVTPCNERSKIWGFYVSYVRGENWFVLARLCTQCVVMLKERIFWDPVHVMSERIFWNLDLWLKIWIISGAATKIFNLFFWTTGHCNMSCFLVIQFIANATCNNVVNNTDMSNISILCRFAISQCIETNVQYYSFISWECCLKDRKETKN